MNRPWPPRGPTPATHQPNVPDIGSLSIPPASTLTPVLRSTLARMMRFNLDLGDTEFQKLLIRCEATASSAIEQLHVPSRNIALAGLDRASQPAASMVVDNIKTLEIALEHADQLTVESMLTALIPADSAAALSALDELACFMQRTDIDPLTQAAIVHAQFVTLHPHTEGNGRTGRAIVTGLLRARGATPHLIVPVSAGLLANPLEYSDALEAYRRGDINPIVELFVFAALRALDNSEQLYEDLQTLQREIYATVERVTENLKAVTELCTSEPAFNARMVEQLGVPTASGYRIINHLVDHGILRTEQKIHGQSVWTVSPLNRFVDTFIQRAMGRTASAY